MPFKDTNRRKEYLKAYRQEHKEEAKEQKKAWREVHKEEIKKYMKAYFKSNKEEIKEKNKTYYEAHKEECFSYKKDYIKSDLNSLGQTKHSIRCKSQKILKKSGIKIPGYENHHCFGYEDPNKFIYCSKEIHLKIHQFLRDNNIDADTDHYEQIKHLLDETVVLFGV